MDDLRNYLYIASATLSVGAMIYTWLSSRSKANAQAIADIMERLGKQERSLIAELHNHDTRIARAESTLSAIADLRADIGRVFVRIDGVSKTSNHIDGQLEQLNKTVGMVVQHLIEDGK